MEEEKPGVTGGPAGEPVAAAMPGPAWLGTVATRKVLVIGDAIADLWVYGAPRRISREAPVLILEYQRQVVMPGGAAHCARSVASLGAHALLASRVGDDLWGRALLERLEDHGVQVVPGSLRRRWRTPLKVRFVAAPKAAPAQQVLRLDVPAGWAGEGGGQAWPGEGSWGPHGVDGGLEPGVRAHSDGVPPPVPPMTPDPEAAEESWTAVAGAVADADAVVVADYGLTDLTVRLWPHLRRWAAGRPVVVDSRHRLLSFRGATVATPNVEELAEAWGGPVDNADDVVRAGEAILSEAGFSALVVTRGPEGMTVLRPGQPAVHVPPVQPAAVYDVTGAGDTVAATLALALASGLSVLTAARVANVAGSLAVRKPGTEPVTARELADALARAAASGPS